MKTGTPLERDIVKAIMKALTEHGVQWLVKTHGGPYQSTGLPDIIAVTPHTGRFLGIEVKRPSLGKLTDLQRAQIERINRAGGVAGVAYDVDDALGLLDTAEREETA